jgi:hypothetical protein
MTRPTLITLTLGACASSPHGREHELENVPMSISPVAEICEILTREPLTPDAAREALGRSGSPVVRAARVFDAVDRTEPNVIELELPDAVPLATFEHAFGRGDESVRIHLGDPVEWVYAPPSPAGRRHRCAIIARVADDGVRVVIVRRDPHA